MKAFYPGTFDPPTLGHLHIIEKASKLFDHVEVGVAEDTQKKTSLLGLKDREMLLKEITKHFSNVSISSYENLTVEEANKLGCDVLIRALRNASDIEHEIELAEANRKLGDIETLFLLPSSEFQAISSSVVRDIASRGGNLEPFLPKKIIEQVIKMQKHRERS